MENNRHFSVHEYSAFRISGGRGGGNFRKSLEKARFCITEDSGSLGFSNNESRINGAVKKDHLSIFTG